jgi:hypothetical protein
LKELTVAVNLIVLAVTLLVAGFVLVWICFPPVRTWIEAPKYRVLEWPERFPDGALPKQEPGEEVPQR